eukprot:jgi/Hompol1/2000/HPOL_002840-RA
MSMTCAGSAQGAMAEPDATREGDTDEIVCDALSGTSAFESSDAVFMSALGPEVEVPAPAPAPAPVPAMPETAAVVGVHGLPGSTVGATPKESSDDELL